jgi:hypothetical protein
VLQPDPTISDPGGYPLTTLTYGALTPLALDQQSRDEYAAFIEYAIDQGQQVGLAPGQLPRGYAPLPLKLQAAGLQAADLVRDPTSITPPSTTTTTVAATSTTTVPPSTTAATTTTSVAPQSTTATTPTNTFSTLAPSPTFSSSFPSSFPSGNGNSPLTPTVTFSTTPLTDTASTSPTSAPESTETTVPVTTAVAPGNEPAPDAGFTATTPILAMTRSRYAVPAFGCVALGSALGALEITKRPRRSSVPLDAAIAGGPPDPDQPPALEES